MCVIEANGRFLRGGRLVLANIVTRPVVTHRTLSLLLKNETMKRTSWLLLCLPPAIAALSAACSPKFTTCEAKGTCPSGGSAGAQTAAGGGGRAGEAGETGVEGGGRVGEDGGNGEAGAPDVPPALLGTCSVKRAFACVGHAGAQRLACDGERWQAGPACGAGELCDSSAGTCAPIVTECVSATPGAVVCRNDTLLTCGPDLVTVDEGATCAGLCKLGVCQAPICGDEKVEPGEDCDDPAPTIGPGGVVPAADSGPCVKCKTAACGDGAIYVGHEQCDDRNKLSGDGCSAACRAEPVALALGGHTTCVLSSTGLVKCWGLNAQGELGSGGITNLGDVPSTVPSRLPAIDLGAGRKVTAISVSGGSTACAILDNGDLKCWGRNKFGQLGTGDTDDRGGGPGQMGDALQPIRLGNGRKALGVSAGVDYTCAVLDDGSVKCWGDGGFGRLGQESAVGATSPESLSPIKLTRKAKAISTSDIGVTCALLDNGTLKCWGNVYFVTHAAQAELGGDPGIGDYPGEMSGLPELVFSGGHSAQSLVAGMVSAAILDDGSLRLWGTSSVGQLGQPGTTAAGLTPGDLAALPPVPLGSGRTAKSIAVGPLHACAVLNLGELKCWGGNSEGQLGLGSPASSVDQKPQDVGPVYLGGATARQVAAGQRHTCAILDDGTLKCWGLNASGQLGLGDTKSRGDTGGQLGADTTVDLTF